MNAKQKEKLAERLTVAIGDDFVVNFEPSWSRSEENRRNGDNPSQGHLWRAMFFADNAADDDPNWIWLDDRKGDVRQQLVDALRARAAMFVAMAAKVEREIRKTTERKSEAVGAA